MQRVVQVRDRLVSAVNGQGVLDEVVGTDGQKIKVAKKDLEGQGGGGYFYHGANLHRAVRRAPVIEFGARMVNQGQGLADFAGVHQHRNEELDFAKGRSAQNGAQLGEKHGWISQAPANGAQAQRGVEVGVVLQRFVQRLVGANVHRANRDGHALHALNGAPVGLKLFFFVGQLALATHEQKFAAKQTHAHGTGLDGAGRVLGHFNVGQQFNLLPVKRHCRGMQQA